MLLYPGPPAAIFEAQRRFWKGGELLRSVGGTVASVHSLMLVLLVASWEVWNRFGIAISGMGVGGDGSCDRLATIWGAYFLSLFGACLFQPRNEVIVPLFRVFRFT